jgi:basic amino acid/polyamine antiporter, APA family
MLRPMSEQVQPARTLGLIDTACVVIGAVIGVGIFMSPGQVAKIAGTPGLALAGWALAGLIAMCGALAFAELGRRRYGVGAQYQVLRDSYGPLGPLAGFVFVFCNASFVQVGAIVVISVICVNNLATALGRDDLPELTLNLMGAGVILAISAINIIGVKFGSAVQNFTVAAKVIALLAVAALAAFATPSPTPPPAPALAAGANIPLILMACLVPAFFAYGGWQQGLWISGEVKNPRRTLPIAILAGTAVVIAVYLLVNWAYLKLLGIGVVMSSKSIAADAVGSVFPAWGKQAIAGAVSVSAFGVLNAALLTGPRLIQALAADGLFWKVFARVNPRTATPVAAIAALGGLAAVVLLVVGQKRVDQVTAGVVVMDGLFFLLTAASIYLLKAEEPPLPGSRIAAGLFILGEVGLVTGALAADGMRNAAMISVGWLLAAVVFYFIMAAVAKRRAAR